MNARRRTLLKACAWALAGVALALAFAAYQRPEVAVDLANQLWNCF